MRWRYALVVMLVMQAGLLLSRAVVGSTFSGVPLGDALANNAVASLIWLAPVTIAIAAVNLFAFLGLFGLVARSEPRPAWWKGAVAALLTALLIVALNLAWQTLSESFANVTFYEDRTPQTIAEWVGHAAFIAWSFLVGGGLIPLARGRVSTVTRASPTPVAPKR